MNWNFPFLGLFYHQSDHHQGNSKNSRFRLRKIKDSYSIHPLKMVIHFKNFELVTTLKSSTLLWVSLFSDSSTWKKPHSLHSTVNPSWSSWTLTTTPSSPTTPLHPASRRRWRMMRIPPLSVPRLFYLSAPHPHLCSNPSCPPIGPWTRSLRPFP